MVQKTSHITTLLCALAVSSCYTPPARALDPALTLGYLTVATAKNLIMGRILKSLYLTIYHKITAWQQSHHDSIIADIVKPEAWDSTDKEYITHFFLLVAQHFIETATEQTAAGSALLEWHDEVKASLGASLTSYIKIPRHLGIMGHSANFTLTCLGIALGLWALHKRHDALQQVWYTKDATLFQKAKGFCTGMTSTAAQMLAAAWLTSVVNRRAASSAWLYNAYSWWAQFSFVL